MQTSTRITFATLLALALAPCLAAAQGEEPTKPETVVRPLASQAKPEPQAYSLTVSIKEAESGKAAVEKSYILAFIADTPRANRASVRDGDKIPYMSDKGQQWADVGTNIDVIEAMRRGESLAIDLRVSSSSLVAKTNGVDLPQMNQWTVDVNAVLPSGKATLVYSTTDAVSGRKIEIVATALALGTK